MPQVQYPFIDIAVHPAVRARFAAGDAIALFSADMENVLWANGEGAAFFGFSDVYDFLDQGPNRASVAFRQLSATASQLTEVGDRRALTIRTSNGFQSAAAQADVSLVEIRRDEVVIIFAAPVASNRANDTARIASMLRGFDDPDTHIAVLDGDGNVLHSSRGFGGVGIAPETTRSLIASLRKADGLIKRPIASAAGYLPAALGTVSENPPLHLLFCVETVLGRMDPPGETQPVAAQIPADLPTSASDAAEDTFDEPEAPFADEPSEETELATPQRQSDDGAVAAMEGDVSIASAGGTELAADMAETGEAQAVAPDDFVEEAAMNENVDGDDINALAALDLGAPEELEEARKHTETFAEATAEREIAVEAGTGHAGTDADTAATEFQFRRDGRPVRFVWKLDAQGRFAEVSDEFARTVGPLSGDINGLHFQELAYRYNLDADGEIGRLLERRDTWSGRTIRWPVEGTNLLVPVDLAALPTYSRNREFDGFRGFGIIRVGDAELDPLALGLTFSDNTEQQDEGDANGRADIDPNTASSASGDKAVRDDGELASTQAGPAPGGGETDEFQGEKPALDIVSNPLATFSEKIVQLEERRASRAREGLTVAEQNALKEIARQLEPFGKRPNELVTGTHDDHNDGGEHVGDEIHSEDADPDTESDHPSLDTGSSADHEGQAEASTLHEPQTGEHAAEDADEAGHIEENLANGVDPGLTSSAADQVPVAMLIHTGDRLIHANAEFRRISGYETLHELQAAGGIDALIERRDGPHGGVFIVRADGIEIAVSARLQSVRFDGASALMLTLSPAATPEVDDRADEEQEDAHRLAFLQVEIDELKAILETATDGVVVLDMEGRIRSMNRSASALFNYDDNETRGKPFAMLFAHESQRAVQDYLAGLSGHGVASVLNDGREVIGREASGGFIPLFMTMGRMAGSNSYCAVIRDITQWKRSEEELKAARRSAETANQHKSDFLARVSHEIRTPLNAIIGFSDMIASEHFGPAGHPRYVEYANDIGRSGRHVLDIVNDLLDISKIEAGEMDLEFAAVGLNDCVSEAVSLVQPQANAQRVIIRTSLSQSVPEVVADLRSVKQIAINILANAIRFTPSGGQIVVSTAYEPNGSVVLRIRDTGIGMSKSELEQAMRPFGQVQPGARKRGDGTGLGLPLTKAMIEANRAVFAIQSAPNEGTLVEITFPPQRVLAN